MGYSLDEKHLILSEKEYKQLKDKITYIKSPYDLTIIDFSEMISLKKEQFFNIIESNVEQNAIWLSSLQEDLKANYDQKFGDNIDIFDYFDKELRYECEELPLSLDEWLNYDNDGDIYILRKITEEEIEGTKFYLITLIMYW